MYVDFQTFLLIGVLFQSTMFAMHVSSNACVVLCDRSQSVSFALVIYKKLEIKKKFTEGFGYKKKKIRA